MNFNNQYRNILVTRQGGVVVRPQNVLDFRDIPSTSDFQEFRIKWGDNNYYPESISDSVNTTIDTINSIAVNKWDAVVAYLYERIIKRNEYPIVEITISLDSWDDIFDWQESLGHYIAPSGMEGYLEQEDIDTTKLLLMGIKVNVKQKTLLAQCLYLPEEI